MLCIYFINVSFDLKETYDCDSTADKVSSLIAKIISVTFISEPVQESPHPCARCFKQIWKVGKVGKVGKIGKVGREGR